MGEFKKKKERKKRKERKRRREEGLREQEPGLESVGSSDLSTHAFRVSLNFVLFVDPMRKRILIAMATVEG